MESENRLTAEELRSVRRELREELEYQKEQGLILTSEEVKALKEIADAKRKRQEFFADIGKRVFGGALLAAILGACAVAGAVAWDALKKSLHGG